MESLNAPDQETELLPQGDGSSSTTAAFRYSFEDEDELMKKIRDTYDSDKYAIAVKPLLYIIDVIFYGATDLRGFIEVSLSHDTINLQVQDMVEELPTTVISAITYQLFSKCSAGEDVHIISMEVLEIIKDYNWDSKVVLAFLAFAVIFGECRLVIQHFFTTNPLAKAVALIKQCAPEILMEDAKALKPELVDELFALFGEIMEVTENIVEFFDFPLHDYFTDESPEFITANSLIPRAVYWAIRSIVVSATQMLGLTGMGSEFLIVEQHESGRKLVNIKGHLVDLIECRNRSSENKIRDGYEDIVRILGSSNADNSESLKILLDKPGVYDCYNKKKISNEQLKSKVVALFITDLDRDLTSGAEYAILQQMYLEKWHNLTRTESKYEVVWLPIVDTTNWTTEKIKLFESLRNQMKWHSVGNPSNVNVMVIRFIKENWNFMEKPLLVVMDTQGKIVHKNGIHMMCIWGIQAYPFTASREKLLWEEMSWSIDLLADNMELNMNIWIQEGKHICLYGGDDENWIRRFTKIAKDVANEAAISLEMLYVGRSKLRKKLVNMNDIIQKENLSRTLDWNLMWYFWVRLESMLYSKQLIESGESDPILQGIIGLLSYDSKHQNWAIISCGPGKMVMANGEYVLKGLRQLRKRKPMENKIDIVYALDEYIRKICPPVSYDYTSLVLGATELKKDDEAFEAIARILESSDIHNSKSIDTLFHYGYGQRAIYDCYNKKQISNNDLRRKIVVLFITDLDPALPRAPEYFILQNMYLEKRQNPMDIESRYDVVWLPVVDFWVEDKFKLFESLRDQMEWLSVHHPLVVSPVIIRYIKEKFNFVKKPMLVVMDAQGKIVHHNAIFMMCIWGTSAYPFTIDREKLLWQGTIWSINLLLAFNIEPNLFSWLQDGRHICLYGGEDIEWIQKFTRIAKDVAREAGIAFELLYVGNCDANEKTKTIIDMIQKENLSRTFDLFRIWFFWLRLEGMWFSKRQLTKTENLLQNDPMMQSIIEMLNYGDKKQGWAMISWGQDEIVQGSGENMLKALAEHEQWKTKEDEIRFVPALDEYLRTMHLTLPQEATGLTVPATEKRKADEAFETLGRIFITAHIDNSKPLSALFHYNDGQPALYDCLNKKRITTDELRRKIVALFITDLNPGLAHGSEYAILQQMYCEKRDNPMRAESQYEVVWIPIADYWDDDKYRLFESLRDQMEEWYSIHHPSVVSPVVIRYIKERWNFNTKPMLVVMDTQGKIVHHNAIHMMCIWGVIAYPFTNNREKLLWEEMSWSIDLLVDGLEPNLPIWLQEGRHICLYGGEDVDWIQKFTRIAKDVAREAGITLKLLYVGWSKPKERVVNTIIEMIHKENLSSALDWNLIWLFWTRLESMWYSKVQLTKVDNIENDPIMRGIIKMLSYGSSERGWALICRGFGEMVMGNEGEMLRSLAEHDQWKQKEDEMGFVPALDEYLHYIPLIQQANRLILPGSSGDIPERVVCAECGRVMEKFIEYRPCLD